MYNLLYPLLECNGLQDVAVMYTLFGDVINHDNVIVSASTRRLHQTGQSQRGCARAWELRGAWDHRP